MSDLNSNSSIKLTSSTFIVTGSNVIPFQSKYLVTVASNGYRSSETLQIKIYGKSGNEIIYENSKTRTKNGNVFIGNNCWIGVNVLIIEGVSVGSNVVIGGNSVVTKNIPSNCVVAGATAKIIKINDKK